ncbi:hypothetical protein SAMN05421753_10899 [Planctomicrobium piriforme]|uniref:Uncharacterized protein n=1 Tax=Planctomicrobium piriforme TaxID=1576369 RepID=A0A1I3HKJ1_9PLAN|nr:hypothetical protein SAMN05421753_10899 [Planctomicrobium piriforme]
MQNRDDPSLGNDPRTLTNLEFHSGKNSPNMGLGADKPEERTHRFTGGNPFFVGILVTCVPVAAIVMKLGPISSRNWRFTPTLFRGNKH